jgi:tRNA(Ile)-lysidine synthase
VQVTIAPEYLGRFSDALARLGVGEDERIMLAVSGGPDSLALLLLAHQHAAGRIIAATVDHQLRPESADEALYVGQICRQLDVAHLVLAPTQEITGNIQSSARAARYELLAGAADEYKCPLIATAHHADDQLETLLMRLARGSGVSGMAGIRARNGRIIRPLLEFSKAELEEICTDADIQPVRDPSNDNADFDRVAMRQYLARGDAAIALDWMTTALAERRISGGKAKITMDNKGLPKEIQRRLLLLALQRIETEIEPRGEALERLLADLEVGKTTTIGDILCQGGDVWQFSPAPPRRSSG